MWGIFWFGAERQAPNNEVGTPVRTGPAAEQFSGVHKAPPSDDEAGEIAEFLARVYAHQEC